MCAYGERVTRTVGERASAWASSTITITIALKFRHESVSRVSFGVHATQFPFSTGRFCHTHVECIVVLVCCASQIYYWQSVALLNASLTASLFLYFSLYVFFLNIYHFFRWILFCFGRLLSVTITWKTDSPFSSFCMICAIWLVPRIHLSQSFIHRVDFVFYCEKYKPSSMDVLRGFLFPKLT